MTKDTKNKPRLDLVPTALLYGVAKAMEFGAQKYGRNDWRDGGSYGDYVAALLRHVLAFHDGEDHAPDSGVHHLAHAGACIAMLLDWQARGLGDDDRYKQPSGGQAEPAQTPVIPGPFWD